MRHISCFSLECWFSYSFLQFSLLDPLEDARQKLFTLRGIRFRGPRKEVKQGPDVLNMFQLAGPQGILVRGDQASEHRAVTRVAKSLRQKFPATVPLELSDQVVWSSILESFLHTQEKHDTFTMLHLKVLLLFVIHHDPYTAICT